MTNQINELLTNSNLSELGIEIALPIEEYVAKIYENSTIIPYVMQSSLKGFISYYNNDPTKTNAFLTMLFVSDQHQGKGIGRLLLQTSIADLKRNGFLNYSLEVLKTNEKAIQLYMKYGFKIKEDRGNIWLMNMDLNSLNL